MVEFFAACKAAFPGVLVSAVASGLIIHYIRSYIDRKLKEEEEKQGKMQKVKLKRSQLEMQRRRALGKVLFWLHRGLTKPPPNGELEEAMEQFNDIERQQHELEQKLLAGLMIEEDLE